MGTKNNPGAFDCYHKAEPDEPVFVLLGRDPCAGVVVREWADKRAKDLAYRVKRDADGPGPPCALCGRAPRSSGESVSDYHRRVHARMVAVVALLRDVFNSDMLTEGISRHYADSPEWVERNRIRDAVSALLLGG